MHIFLQARLGSTRLPRKVLLPLEGESVIARVVERLRPLNYPIVLVTGPRKQNRALIDEARRLGILCYAGSEENLLDRFFEAANKYEPHAIIRVTGDCPLIDSALIREGVRIFKQKKYDLVTNARIRSFPDGLDYEIFSSTVLRKAWKQRRKEFTDPKKFKHTFFGPTKEIAQLKGIRVKDIVLKPAKARERWTLDYPADYKAISAIYRALLPKVQFSWRDVLAYLRKHPNIKRMNDRYVKLDY